MWYPISKLDDFMDVDEEIKVKVKGLYKDYKNSFKKYV